MLLTAGYFSDKYSRLYFSFAKDLPGRRPGPAGALPLDPSLRCVTARSPTAAHVCDTAPSIAASGDRRGLHPLQTTPRTRHIGTRNTEHRGVCRSTPPCVPPHLSNYSVAQKSREGDESNLVLVAHRRPCSGDPIAYRPRHGRSAPSDGGLLSPHPPESNRLCHSQSSWPSARPRPRRARPPPGGGSCP